jgi:hypothetical protein
VLLCPSVSSIDTLPAAEQAFVAEQAAEATPYTLELDYSYVNLGV